MSEISFYPGPSRVYSNITEHIYEAYMSGILSANHRSEPFMELVAKAKSELHRKLKIPADYTIGFVSSATECWEIVAQSLVKNKMLIAYNGAFGEKWAKYGAAIVPELVSIEYDLNDELPIDQLAGTSADTVCLVHSETSNGTMIDQSLLKELRASLTNDELIAIDATSSLGGIEIDFEIADVWFASVQKCLGLPAGMGLIILSPAAVDRALSLNRSNAYNSLSNIIANTRKNQTHYTPNTLSIFLLHKTQELSKGITHQNEKINQRYTNWQRLISELDGVDWLIKNQKVRSKTVLTLSCMDPGKLKNAALEKSIVLGNGYGPWKENTFRIANFPAIKGKEIEKLVKFLERYFN